MRRSTSTLILIFCNSNASAVWMVAGAWQYYGRRQRKEEREPQLLEGRQKKA